MLSFSIGASLTAILLQNTAASVTFYLSTTGGSAATGIVYSSVTAGLKKEGDSVFSAFTVNASNWHEISNGYYSVDFTSSNTNVIGNLYLSLSIPGVNPTLVTSYVAATVAPTVGPSPMVPGKSLLYGFLLDAAGSPISGAPVSFKVLGAPVTVSGSGISITSVTAISNSSGYFYVSLLQGLTVDVICAAVNYRRTLVVPTVDSNIFEIP